MVGMEPLWLFSYSLLSFAYRMLVATVIILFVGGQMFVIGILLAIWAGYAMVLLPLLKQLRYLFTDQRLAERRQRAWAVSSAVVMTLLLLLTAVQDGTGTAGYLVAGKITATCRNTLFWRTGFGPAWTASQC